MCPGAICGHGMTLMATDTVIADYWFSLQSVSVTSMCHDVTARLLPAVTEIDEVIVYQLAPPVRHGNNWPPGSACTPCHSVIDFRQSWQT